MTRRIFAVGIAAAFSLAPLIGAEVPRQSPEFVVRMMDGRQLLLSGLRGKVLAVEFLHTTCPHCQNCSTILNKMYKEYGPRGLQVVGVAFNDMAGLLVPDYVKHLGLEFPVGMATRDEVLSYLRLSPVERFYVPQLVFIDRKGVIRGQYSGENEFFKNEEANVRSQIESLLKEPATTQKSRPAPKSSKGKGVGGVGKPASVRASQALQ